ncbi:lipase family protein [Pseudoclavibacter sp. AY1F1]|uniref:lipase family protein n=1 Tax=Pseudoclavibacter sp. AY1F1 TaxID=2080583 RepID=UPI0021577142|nr:lipase family protein [Pseudoclavibacter sp. AY1F1]
MLALVAIVVGAEVLRVSGDTIEQGELAAFYEQPGGGVLSQPGTLVRSEQLLGTPIGSQAWRIMYSSTDLNGAPVLVTGVVVVPDGEAPDGGRTVLAWGHPTTGTDPSCAPSRAFDPFIGVEGLRLMLDRGYAVVATDYLGMGIETADGKQAGQDSYLVGETAARSVLDAVRAAQQIEAAEAGAEVVLWGHSQGGQAVLFAAQEAPSYAPELKIAAVAAAAPAADLTKLMGSHLDDISGVTIGAYAFPAFAEVYAGVPGAELSSILTPPAIEKVAQMNSLCLLSSLTELHEIGQPLVGDFTLQDPTSVEPWATLLAENSTGSKAFEAPLFIAQGSADELVLPADTAAFVSHEESIGVDVHAVTVPGASHGTIAYEALPELERWLEQHVPDNGGS